MKKAPAKSGFQRLLHGLVVVTLAVALTLACFLLLPLMQAIAAGQDRDLLVRDADVVALPERAPPPPVEPEPEPEREEPPPEVNEPPPLLSLAELELALNATFEGDFGQALSIKLDASATSRAAMDEMLSFADLDQEATLIHKVMPVLDAKLRKKTPATVNLLLQVDERGRVEDAKVLEASNPDFVASALAAVKQWKFQPAKRKGRPARQGWKQVITFPAKS